MENGKLQFVGQSWIARVESEKLKVESKGVGFADYLKSFPKGNTTTFNFPLSTINWRVSAISCNLSHQYSMEMIDFFRTL